MKTTTKSLLSVAIALLAAFPAWALEGPYTNGMGLTLAFMPDNLLRVTRQGGGPGPASMELSYELDGNRVTITSSRVCNGETGVYTFEENDEGVTLTLVSDDCSGRVADLTDVLWTKAP